MALCRKKISDTVFQVNHKKLILNNFHLEIQIQDPSDWLSPPLLSLPPARNKATVNTLSVKKISNVVGALLRPISACEASLAITKGCSIMVGAPYMSENMF